MTGVLLLTALASIAHGQTRGGFDGQGHLLMHGTPRFVLGVYDSGGTYSTDPAFWENAIFSPSGPRGLQGFPLNVYLNYWLGGMPIGATTALLDVLNTHAVMYLATGNCFADGSWLRYGPTGFSIADQSYVQQFAQHPAALGYYIMDECDDALIPETQQHYQQLKSWDPQGLSLATNLAAAYRDPGLWVNAADVLAIDPYVLYGVEPSQGYPHFVVADFTARLRAKAPPTRPIWTVLQFFQFTTDSRLPTAGELRAQAVMAIVEGAQGLFWWDIGVNGLRQLDAVTVATYMSHLKTLTSELAGLEPALLAVPADGALVGNTTRFADPVAGRIAQLQHNIAVEILYSRVQADQAEIAALQAGDTSKSPLLAGAANVRTRTKVVNGLGYVFAYNYTNLPQGVTFTWQSALGTVIESKTGQSFPVSGASWSDTFGPYEARIYIVTAGTPPPSGLKVSFTNPSSGATVSGSATVTLAASGGTGTGYGFKVTADGTTIYTGTNPSFTWNTTTVANGSRTLTATVTDSASATATASVTVNVNNSGSAFDYAVTNSGAISIARGTGGATKITATLKSGSSQAVQLSATGLPSGVTASFTAVTCSPSCTSTLILTAAGATPTGTFPVTVTGSPLGRTTTFNLSVAATPFTDGSGPTSALSTGTTVIKAAHVLELRTAIDNLRAVSGLPGYSWSDPALTVKSTTAARAHFLDLRSALAPLCAAAPGKCVGYTDVTLSSGHTVIKAIHINELRANVVALQ
jgi:Big-like domain-containing protein